MEETQRTGIWGTLEARARSVEHLDAVRKRDVQFGDCVLVTTKNSVYSIWVLGNDLYRVTGGWFDREGQSPSTMTIHGCTWGGRAIASDILAAPGLFLEFGNDVITTRIRDVRVLRASERQASC